MLLAKHRVGKKKKKKEEEKKKLRYDCSEGKVFAIIVTMMTTVLSLGKKKKKKNQEETRGNKRAALRQCSLRCKRSWLEPEVRLIKGGEQPRLFNIYMYKQFA